MSLKSSRLNDHLFKCILAIFALFSILTTLAIIYILFKETFLFFKQVPFLTFIFGFEWSPLLEPKSFGVLPLVSGTALILFLSGILSIPTGLAAGIYLSEFCPPKITAFLKPSMEVLASIPTIVYGYFAITFITPILQKILPQTEIFNALSASIVVAIMIFPMITSLCGDAIKSVPKEFKEGGYALGATDFEVLKDVTLPHCYGRIYASFILAISRAIGETMAVTLAAGSTPRFTLNPLESIQTMTAYIVQVSLGDTPHGGIESLTCFAIGSLLFIITFILNLIGQSLIFKRAK